MPHQKIVMLRIEKQESYNFDDLTTVQSGWGFSVSQLGPSDAASSVSLCRTSHVNYHKFQFNPAYDQRIHSSEGFLSFGLLDVDNPPTWAYDQLIPNDALTVFPNDDDLKAASPAGFRGSGMHFSEDFMANLAEKIYDRPLSLLIPMAGSYITDAVKLGALRKELHKWQQLTYDGTNASPAIIARREESLAVAVIEALLDERYSEKSSLTKSRRSMSLALDMIHDSELENISAMDLCRSAECSQRTLEKCFTKRFGVTPKKYIKCLRLAEVNKGLRNFDAHGYESIIELAGINGFWHMGQFAADYRRIYGELPSETLIRL